MKPQINPPRDIAIPLADTWLYLYTGLTRLVAFT